MVNEAESRPLLPEHFYISGIPKKRKLPKLFRPKELRQYVFPELGMIMYDFFWVKYTLFLIKEGYIPWEQENLFFWAIKAGKIDPLKSVLYFSLLSKTSHKKDVSVGRNFAREWLFKGIEWRDNVVNGLLEFSVKGRDFNFPSFVEQIFSSDFKSDCRKFGIDLSKLADKVMVRAFESLPDGDTHTSAVKSFCIFIGDLLYNKGIIKNYPHRTGAVVDPNIDFTKKILLFNTTELDELHGLANTDFGFTRKEILILLNRLLRTEQGRYFLASVILVSYLNPIQKRRVDVREQLRNIYKHYRIAKDFEDRVESAFSPFEIPKIIFGSMQEICFYWELNFFLSDGETIARKIIGNRSIISRRQISEYFEKNRGVVRDFESFLETLASDSERLTHLDSFIHILQKAGDKDTTDFLFQLSKSLKQRRKICDIFIDLLLVRGTLKKESENLYFVTGTISEKMSEAIFYGIDPLIDWTTTILRGLKNEE